MEKRKCSLKSCRANNKPAGKLFSYNLQKSTSNKENEDYTCSLSNMIKTKLAKFEEHLETSKIRNHIKREISLKSLAKSIQRDKIGGHSIAHKYKKPVDTQKENSTQNISLKLSCRDNSFNKQNNSSLSRQTTNISSRQISFITNADSSCITRNKILTTSSTNYTPQELIKMFNQNIASNSSVSSMKNPKVQNYCETVKSTHKCRNKAVVRTVKTEKDLIEDNYRDYERKMSSEHTRTASKYNYTDNPSLILSHDNTSTHNLNLWYLCFGVPLNDLLDPIDKILCEGKIFKYKPGLSNVYSERWMQMTESGVIRIYKDQIQSIYYPNNPLAAIPMSVIEGVKKVNLKNPIFRNNISIEK